MITIRTEQVGDEEAIWRVTAAAFGRAAEADLVNALRDGGGVVLSLVAVEAGEIVGHVLFTPMVIKGDDGEHQVVALGPLSVAPDEQRKGVGSQLVRAGLDLLKQAGHQAVILLGHPTYYPRFGFAPSTRYGIRWEKNVPEEVFMALELVPGALESVKGVAYYRPEFDEM